VALSKYLTMKRAFDGGFFGSGMKTNTDAAGVTAMFGSERRRRIAELVELQERASVAELASRFQVSEVTIRKDLVRLEAQRVLTRVHGGAILADDGGRHAGDDAEPAFQLRERLQQAEKSAIGAAAARLIEDGDSIAMDASTTALQVARHLRGKRDLTVITNGMRIATELAGQPGVTILLLGGRLRWEACSLVGTWGEPMLGRVNVQKAVVGAVGLTLEHGLTDVTEDEAEVKRAMVVAAQKVVAVIDHTKWGRVALSTFCPIDRVHLVITDARAPGAMVAEVRARGIEVRTAGG
jgi:DeoR/GlpR family transcriptional regulator of sugar metabolism